MEKWLKTWAQIVIFSWQEVAGSESEFLILFLDIFKNLASCTPNPQSELSGEGKEKSKGIQSHKRVESATAPATLTATPQREKEPMKNATAG